MELSRFLGLTLLFFCTRQCDSAFKTQSYTLLTDIPRGEYINHVIPTKGSIAVYYEITKMSHFINGIRVPIGNKSSYLKCQGVPFCIDPSTSVVRTTDAFSLTPGKELEVTITPLTPEGSRNSASFFSIRASCPYKHLYPFFSRKEFKKCLKKQYALPSVNTYSRHGVTFVSSSSMYLYSYLEIDFNLIPMFKNVNGTFIATVTSGRESLLKNWDPEKNTTSGRFMKFENFMFYRKAGDKITIPLDWPVYDEVPKFIDVYVRYYQISQSSSNMNQMPTPTSMSSLGFNFEDMKKIAEAKLIGSSGGKTNFAVLVQFVPLIHKAVKLIGISMKSICEDTKCIDLYWKEFKRNTSKYSENCRCCVPMAGLHERCKDIERLRPLSIKPDAYNLKMRDYATLTCNYSKEYLASEMKWLKDGKKADFGKFAEKFSAVVKKQKINSVVFEITKPYQQGYYSCHAENIYRLKMASKKTLLLLSDVSYMKFVYDAEISRAREALEYKDLNKDLIRKINESFNENGINSSRAFETKATNKGYEIHVTFLNMRMSDRQNLCKKLGNIKLSLKKQSALKTFSFDCCSSSDGYKPHMLINSTFTTYNSLNDTFKQMIIKRCIWNDTHGAQWSVESDALVRTSHTLKELSNIQVTKSNSLKVSENLVAATKRLKQKSGKIDVKSAIDIMEKIVATDQQTKPKIAENVLKVTSVIMDLDRTTVPKSQGQRIVKLLQNVADTVELESNTSLKIEDKNVAMLVFEIVMTNHTPGIFLQALNDTSGKNTIENDFTSNPMSTGQKQASLFLSPSTIRTAAAKSNNTNLRVTSFLYQNSKFFRPPQNIKVLTKKEMIKRNNNQNYKERNKHGERYSIVNSKVISTSFKDVKLQNLTKSEEVVIDFLQLKNSTKSHSCVFWDFSAADGRGNWSKEGCSSDGIVNGYYKCRCNHLTNFALLIDIDQGYNDLTTAEKKSLSIFTYVGCGISLVCLFVTFVTYAASRKLRKNQPTQILMLLCVSLILLMMTFLVGSTANNRPTCVSFGIITHYFLLSSFCWMAVEGINLYLCLVKIMRSTISKFMLKSNLFAWGLPAAIVAVTAGLTKLRPYGRQEDSKWICVISGLPFYLASLLPIVLILAINLVILVLVLRSLGRKSTVSKSNELSNLTKVRIAIGCALLMGATWTVGLFAIGRLTYVVQLIFCALNSLQGLFIFIMYCARHKDVRQQWRKFLRMETLSSLSSKSSNQRHTKSEKMKKDENHDSKPLMNKSYDGAMMINQKKVHASLPGDEAVAVLLRYEERSSFKRGETV